MARKAYLSATSVAIILVAAIVISTGFGSVGIAQGQGNMTEGNVTLTPEQKDAICNPNNPASKLNPVNTTESRICGIPVTIKPHPSNATAASSPNIATGGEAPPSTSSPSPSPPSPSPSSPPSTSIAPEAGPPS